MDPPTEPQAPEDLAALEKDYEEVGAESLEDGGEDEEGEEYGANDSFYFSPCLLRMLLTALRCAGTDSFACSMSEFKGCCARALSCYQLTSFLASQNYTLPTLSPLSRDSIYLCNHSLPLR